MTSVLMGCTTFSLLQHQCEWPEQNCRRLNRHINGNELDAVQMIQKKNLIIAYYNFEAYCKDKTFTYSLSGSSLTAYCRDDVFLFFFLDHSWSIHQSARGKLYMAGLCCVFLWLMAVNNSRAPYVNPAFQPAQRAMQYLPWSTIPSLTWNSAIYFSSIQQPNSPGYSFTSPLCLLLGQIRETIAWPLMALALSQRLVKCFFNGHYVKSPEFWVQYD